MLAKNRFLRVISLCIGIALVLSCTFMNNPQVQEQTNPALEETDIALRVISTSLAIQQSTLDAVQAEMTQQADSLPPIEPAQPTPTLVPTESPTQFIPPSPSSVPSSPTTIPPPAPLVLEIRKSVDTFYCYQPPYELTITVQVSDINRGMAVYYHIRDKISGIMSDDQVLDLHRNSADTRSAVIIGGWSDKQNLQFPPMMGESYFVYQIISDDGKFRSPVYSDITFFPCAQ